MTRRVYVVAASGAVTIALSGASAPGRQSSSSRAPDFQKEIVPILRVCVRCHNADLAEGGLRLDTRDGLRKGGTSGRAVVPGSSASSLIVRRLEDSDPLRRMPQIRDPLPANQIELIRRWIDAGANWPAGVSVGSRRR
jgi:cytochrome c